MNILQPKKHKINPKYMISSKKLFNKWIYGPGPETLNILGPVTCYEGPVPFIWDRYSQNIFKSGKLISLISFARQLLYSKFYWRKFGSSGQHFCNMILIKDLVPGYLQPFWIYQHWLFGSYDYYSNIIFLKGYFRIQEGSGGLNLFQGQIDGHIWATCSRT